MILTRRRVIQLVAFLEAQHALEVRRGHGRGHVNFYRILREDDGEPVPTRSTKKVKSTIDPSAQMMKFPTPPPAEKVQSHASNSPESLGNVATKVVETKEREPKELPGAITPENKAEVRSPFWCDDCRFAISTCQHRSIMRYPGAARDSHRSRALLRGGRRRTGAVDEQVAHEPPVDGHKKPLSAEPRGAGVTDRPRPIGRDDSPRPWLFVLVWARHEIPLIETVGMTGANPALHLVKITVAARHTQRADLHHRVFEGQDEVAG